MIARHLLILVVRAYRRFLSGRGPLRRVRCTFHDTESCSAFGLRAAHESPSARIALGRIRRRLRRCGNVSLFSLTTENPGTSLGTVSTLTTFRALGWGADHDRPLDELHAELVSDREHGTSRALVLDAREVASRWRGDIADVFAVRARRTDAPVVRPRLRRPPSIALVLRMFAWRLFCAAAVVVPMTLVAPIAGLVLAALAALPLAAFVRGHLARRARLAHQARAAALRDSNDQLCASLANRCIVEAISVPRLHSTMPKPSM